MSQQNSPGKVLGVFSHLRAHGKLLSQTNLKVFSCSVDLEVHVWSMLSPKTVMLQQLFIFRLWWSNICYIWEAFWLKSELLLWEGQNCLQSSVLEKYPSRQNELKRKITTDWKCYVVMVECMVRERRGLFNGLVLLLTKLFFY